MIVCEVHRPDTFVKVLSTCPKFGEHWPRLLLSFYGWDLSASETFLVCLQILLRITVEYNVDCHFRAFVSAELHWSLGSFHSYQISLGWSPFFCSLISQTLMEGVVLWVQGPVVGRNNGRGSGKDYHLLSFISILSCPSDWFSCPPEWVGGQVFWTNMPLTPAEDGVGLNPSDINFTQGRRHLMSGFSLLRALA